MKIFTVSAVILLAITSPTSASAENTWSIGLFNSDQEYSKRNEFNAVGLALNYQFTEYLSVEARLAKGTSGEDRPIHNSPYDYSSDIEWQRGLFVKASYPVFDLFNVYAIAGYASTKLSISSVKGRFNENNQLMELYPVDFDKTENGFSYGAGLSYQINNSFSVFAEYQALPNLDNSSSGFSSLDWKSVNLGLNYRF